VAQWSYHSMRIIARESLGAVAARWEPASISSSTVLPSAATPAAAATALVIDGLADDAALAELGDGLVAIRLVFVGSAPQRCCSGHQPTFLAIDPAEPTLSAGDRERLQALGQGLALPGSGLAALAGGSVALPGGAVDVADPEDLGPGLERLVVLRLADAARGMLAAGPADAMSPATVAIVCGEPPGASRWRPAGPAVADAIPLGAGLDELARERAAA